MSKYIYTIEGREVWQKKLNLDQILALQKLAADKQVNLDDLETMFSESVMKVISFLREKDMIKPFVGIILHDLPEDMDPGNIDGDIAIDIFRDFFLINEQLVLKSVNLTRLLTRTFLRKIQEMRSRLEKIRSKP